MPRRSVSFDRAASYYDRTRAMSPGVSEAITDAILAQLSRAAADRLLEIGIGTGRIARPLIARGLPMAGVDIAPAMLAQLVAQLPPDGPEPDLFLADATRLPFRDATFPAILTVHVLHLVSSAEEMLAEVRRVLAPGGVFLHKRQRDPDPMLPSAAWWDAELDRRGHPPIRRLRFDQQREMIRASGAALETFDIAHETLHHDPEEVLGLARRRTHSWTWQVNEDTYAAAFPAYETWFRAHYTDEIVEEITHELEVWRWPGA
jgi:SAM-dependent methyltransferase